MDVNTETEKKTFYVSVGQGEILEPSNMTGNFEFEINATEEERDQLEELFEESMEAQEDTGIRAHIPFREYHNDKENDAADYYLAQIYKKLHELGTSETKAHIESMNILPD
ncbi:MULTISPECIES: hypothetical protein [Paenibacillus]|uniref:Hydrolase n=1 Tax=Paenibacillus radicis (ex Xue et al. 2023) TaxID=2972489 RepID=A0ABT1YG00_9BACL|nr:hypothetical protein [Paenibacillus radicis (ex Xue et al. 2023)]MCR8631153.1 hypothetical protein [Paenibacillus radicis (ex Xue et al. 2023)]